MATQEITPGEAVHKEYQAAHKVGHQVTFHLKVYSPYTVYYNDIATSISAENDTGPFDILAHHKNFMTLLKPCEITIRLGDNERRIKIDRGIMHVKADSVVVFLDV